MSVLPNGVASRRDAILLLSMIDGRAEGELGEWEIDDFTSVPHPDPVIERCRMRARNELIDLLSSSDPADRARISFLIDDMIENLTDEGSVG